MALWGSFSEYFLEVYACEQLRTVAEVAFGAARHYVQAMLTSSMILRRVVGEAR
jgi:hypothetical protein